MNLFALWIDFIYLLKFIAKVKWKQYQILLFSWFLEQFPTLFFFLLLLFLFISPVKWVLLIVTSMSIKSIASFVKFYEEKCTPNYNEIKCIHLWRTHKNKINDKCTTYYDISVSVLFMAHSAVSTDAYLFSTNSCSTYKTFGSRDWCLLWRNAYSIFILFMLFFFLLSLNLSLCFALLCSVEMSTF